MAKLADLKALAADLRKRLRQVDQLTGRATERDRDTQRKRASRAASKEVQVPACEDPVRRAQLEADDTEWLRYYCHELFWYSFTTQQLEMIEAIRNAIRYGGDQSLAASCGARKTKIFARLAFSPSGNLVAVSTNQILAISESTEVHTRSAAGFLLLVWRCRYVGGWHL